MTTIERLQAQIEELEKRIKTISSSQSVVSLLNNISVYINDIKTYLSEFNINYGEHLTLSNQKFENLEQISTQVDELSTKIDELSTKVEQGTENDEAFTTLTSNIQALQTQLENFLGNCDITAEMIQNDISALQTDLGEVEDNISSVESDINSINTSIGEQQTRLNNLQSTQTSMSSAHTSMSNSISGLNTRLTTVEENVSSLTGGIDVSALDDRISNLENSSYSTGSVISICNYPLLIQTKPASDKTNIFTHAYNFVAKHLEYIHMFFEFKYSFSSTLLKTLNLNLYINDVKEKAVVVNLDTNKTSYTLEYIYCPTQHDNWFMFEFVSAYNIYMKNLKVTMYGKDIQMFEFDKDLRVQCINNMVHISKHYNSHLFHKYCTLEELNLDSTTDMTESTNNNFSRVIHGITVNSDTNKKLKIQYKVTLYTSGSKDVGMYLYTPPDYPYLRNQPWAYSISKKAFFNLGTHNSVTITYINRDKIKIVDLLAYVEATTIQINAPITDVWYFANYTNENNYIVGESEVRDYAHVHLVAYNQDGYMYLIANNPTTSVTRIGPGGSYAQSYYQPDGSINAYITRNNCVYKYALVPNSNETLYTSELIQTFTDCDCYYEMIQNKAVIHKVSTNKWELVDQVVE